MNCQLSFAVDFFLETDGSEQSTYTAYIENAVTEKIVTFKAGKRPSFSFYDYYGFYNQKVKDLYGKKIIIKCEELNSTISVDISNETLRLIDKFGLDNIRVLITRTQNNFTTDLYFMDTKLP